MSELSTLFSNIANSIRAKSGQSGTIKAADFPTAISNIPVGSISTVYAKCNEGNDSITVNGISGKNFVFTVTGYPSGGSIVCGFSTSPGWSYYILDTGTLRVLPETGDSISGNTLIPSLSLGHKFFPNVNYMFVIW